MICIFFVVSQCSWSLQIRRVPNLKRKSPVCWWFHKPALISLLWLKQHIRSNLSNNLWCLLWSLLLQASRVSVIQQFWSQSWFLIFFGVWDGLLEGKTCHEPVWLGIWWSSGKPCIVQPINTKRWRSWNSNVDVWLREEGGIPNHRKCFQGNQNIDSFASQYVKDLDQLGKWEMSARQLLPRHMIDILKLIFGCKNSMCQPQHLNAATTLLRKNKSFAFAFV